MEGEADPGCLPLPGLGFGNSPFLAVKFNYCSFVVLIPACKPTHLSGNRQNSIIPPLFGPGRKTLCPLCFQKVPVLHSEIAARPFSSLGWCSLPSHVAERRKLCPTLGKQLGLFTEIFIQNATQFVWRLSFSTESVFQKVTDSATLTSSYSSVGEHLDPA